MKDQTKDLIKAALAARAHAYAPYSHFAVGAALLAADGRVFTGCNLETAAFNSICAERAALAAAISAGVRDFRALAVVGGAAEEAPAAPCFPCGLCRQTLSEFCAADFPVIVARSADDYATYTLTELLPHSFRTPTTD